MGQRLAKVLQKLSAPTIGLSAFSGCECPMCSSTATIAKFVKVHNEQLWTLRQCRKCGLHFTDPIPQPEFLNHCYAGDYHHELRTDGATEHRFGPKYQRYLS